MGLSFIERRQLDAARRVLRHVADVLDIPISVRLWDGSSAPLGRNVDKNFVISIDGPRTVTTLLREPTVENVVRHYAVGNLSFHGGDLLSFIEFIRKNNPKKRLKGLSKMLLFREALPFLFGPGEKLSLKHTFQKDETGTQESTRNNRDYIQFHYDAGNAFYQLFLDSQMQYSCAYFKDAKNSLDQAQHDKLEHTCRKLRLTPGESLLDIGSGWGGLICYAAKNYNVRAHGVTLSKEQYAYTVEKARREGLEKLVTVEIGDYLKVRGTYDKVACVGMFEHIGLHNIPAYFSKMNSLLRDQGILLNHAITRRAKGSKKKFNEIRTERRLLQKFIFPGFAMDHIGHSIEQMELNGFEVRDTESLREHYALTLQHWTRRLESRREEAVRLVGEERYRLWVAYLAGVSFGFVDGYSNIYQTVAVKRQTKGFSGMPLTRQELYS